MSDTIKETSPMMTPDSLRKLLQLSKSFYETHTKKNFGRTDINGSHYSGTVENFGFELLLEARKLLMDKPSLKDLFVDNTMDFYFDIQYSSLIDTYDQQGMLEAVLRKDVFLSDKVYKIRFEECEPKIVLRSEGWGAEKTESMSLVFKDHFVHTTKPPILVIRDADNENNVEEIPLILSTGDGISTDYYFYMETGTDGFIESYDEEMGILITNPITDNMSGLPWIWMCVDIFKLLPDMNLMGNKIFNGYDMLTPGTDGHNVTRLYPYLYGDDSIPTSVVGWYIKAYSLNDGFTETSGQNNYRSKVSKIQLIHFNIDNEPDMSYDITCDSEYVKITLSDRVKWEFKKPREGDYDYDGTTYQNFCYAITSLDNFRANAELDTRQIQVLAAFEVHFDDMYLHAYEGICENAVSGIHVDILSDYSENSVIKKNGTVHCLGDFDGLPKYFQQFKDRTIHRSHVELYSIRDRLNRFTQLTTKKQTAALIFDSAVPQKDLENMLGEQDPNIVYKPDPDEYIYTSDPETVVSMNNVLSELVYVDDDTVGNCNIRSERNLPKFVYHGDRVFSLGSIVFDPELEIARVYYVNNDSIKYINNDSLPEEKRKPPRTLARICDIPTEYGQLIHVENKSASLLFDDKYVRSTSGFTLDELNILWNYRTILPVVIPDNHGPGNKYIIPSSDDINRVLSKDVLMKYGYCRMRMLKGKISLDLDMFAIVNHGTGYEEGDTFYFMIGGKAIDGSVTEVNDEGNVLGIDIEFPEDDPISVYNLDGMDTVVSTNSQSTNGKGLKLNIHIEEDEYTACFPEQMDIPPGTQLIAFKYDGTVNEYGVPNIWLWEMDDNWNWTQYMQMTGEAVNDNPYDRSSRNVRSPKEMLVQNMVWNNSEINIDWILNNLKHIDRDYRKTFLFNVFPSNPTEDISSHIENFNKSDTLYVLTNTDEPTGKFDLTMYRYGIPFDSTTDSLVNSVTPPRYNLLNLSEYYNKTNHFMFDFSGAQPEIFIYSPKRSTVSKYDTPYRDLLLETESHPMTFLDISDEFTDSSYRLKDNVYYYPEYEESKDIVDLRKSLNAHTREYLTNYIKSNLGYRAEPLLYEGTNYEWSSDQLVEYIIKNDPLKRPIYFKDDLRPLRYKGDVVANNVPKKGVTPVGDQPTGGFISCSSEVLSPKVSAGDTTVDSANAFIFMIDDESFEGFNDSFRVRDDDDVDISALSIIIWNNEKYVFIDDKWIRIGEKIMNEEE